MSEEKEQISAAQRGVLAGALAGAVSMIFWYKALTDASNGMFSVTRLGNAKCYILFIILFAAVYVLGYGALSLVRVRVRPIGTGWKLALFAVGAVVSFWLVIPFFRGRWNFPFWFTAIMGIVVLVSVFLAVSREADGRRYAYIGLIVVFGMFWGWSEAAVNTFADASVGSAYNIFHTSAYIDQIFNVYHGVEFQGGLTDLYGHYGLFFWLPLKLFGGTTRTIAAVIGIMGMLTFVFAMTSFCMVVRSNAIRLFTIVTAGLAGICVDLESIYWQNYPHRLFFAALTLFLITIFCRKRVRMRWQLACGIVLTSLSVLWSTECGLICCLMWTSFLLLRYFQEHAFSLRGLGAAVLLLLAGVVLPVLIAFLMANAYHVLHGGGFLAFQEFFGLVNGDYLGVLSTELKWGNLKYLHQVFAFIICLFWGVLHNKIFGLDKQEEKACYAAALSIVGIALSLYYVNRTLAGDALPNLFFACVLGLILSGVSDTLKNLKDRAAIRGVSVYGICKLFVGMWAVWMMFICVTDGASDYSLYTKKYESGAYDYTLVKKMAKDIRRHVPKDTWSTGIGSSALYFELGWKNKSPLWNSVVTEEIAQKDAVLLHSVHYEAVPKEFKKVREFTCGSAVFGYFVKEDQGMEGEEDE